MPVLADEDHVPGLGLLAGVDLPDRICFNSDQDRLVVTFPRKLGKCRCDHQVPISTVIQATTVDRDQLLDSAKDFANHALKAYTEDDIKTVLFNAAISLEHLAKAYLCTMNPALLVELRNGSFDSLLHLTGHGAKAKKPSPRTINGREAVERIKKVLPSLSLPKDRLDQLIDVRDGVVHVRADLPVPE